MWLHLIFTTTNLVKTLILIIHFQNYLDKWWLVILWQVMFLYSMSVWRCMWLRKCYNFVPCQREIRKRDKPVWAGGEILSVVCRVNALDLFCSVRPLNPMGDKIRHKFQPFLHIFYLWFSTLLSCSYQKIKIRKAEFLPKAYAKDLFN